MSRPKITALLVEDDDCDALLVQRLLETTSAVQFSLERVTTAAAATARLDQGEVDSVLLDLGLPDSEGFDTVLRFRRSFPNLPVVVLTGIDDERIGLQALECGAQDFVAKDMVCGVSLCRAIRFAIARQNRIQTYRVEARTDALTNLANRRAFDTELPRRLAEARRHGRPLSLMMLDVDHFKKINDAHGHRVGDFVLSSLATAISETVRLTDIPARYGGEEFAVILPSTNLDESQQVMQRLLTAVSAGVFWFEGIELQATMSAGLAEAKRDDDVSSLVERADTALFFAKTCGRNRGCFDDGQQLCEGAVTGELSQFHESLPLS